MKRQNIILFYLVALLLHGGCQAPENPDWQHLDPQKDGVLGISTTRAYHELLKNRQPTAVIVAVLDGGTDTGHDDLMAVRWINEKEIPGNGLDDDGNGYIDDRYGWNFVGVPDSSLKFDNTALTRLVRQGKKRFGQLTAQTVPIRDRASFDAYQVQLTAFEKARRKAREQLEQLQQLKTCLDKMVQQLGKTAPTLQDFRDFLPHNDQENQVRSLASVKLKRKTYEEFYQEDILERLQQLQQQLAYHYNLEFVPHGAIDSTDISTALWTGNPDVKGPDAMHGTHVAGIIGASRDNAAGIQGIAGHVRLMPVRCIPNGDERDEDVARAIRYAVDNGAKVINMSFGKYYTSDKSLVDDAVRYAMAHDVLLIHAAGNDGCDLDKQPHYPNPFYSDGDKAAAWITVGASDQTDDETLKAPFSNYGLTQVDVFAPGVRIRSTVPDGGYKRLDGTSMAAPVVAGLAATIRSYYPALTARQVREIILKSAVKYQGLTGRCVTGGIVNAYTATQLAEQYKR